MAHTSPWDDRYSSPEFIYGTHPNAFLAEQLASLGPGKALFVSEGEGRNAVHAAQLGWPEQLSGSVTISAVQPMFSVAIPEGRLRAEVGDYIRFVGGMEAKR